MPILSLTANEWTVLGTIIDDATFENNTSDQIIISTDTNPNNRGGLTLGLGEMYTVPADNYVAVWARTNQDISYLYSVSTAPTIAAVEDGAVDEDEEFTTSLSDFTVGNSVIYAIVSCVDAAMEDHVADCTIDPLTGEFSATFADAETYTIVVSVTNSAGTDTDTFDVVVSAP